MSSYYEAAGPVRTSRNASGGTDHQTNKTTQQKVQAALNLFASLKESTNFPPLTEPYNNRPLLVSSRTQQNSALQQKADREADEAIAMYDASQSGRRTSSDNDGGLIYFGSSSEKQLRSMSSRELIRKLAISEAIIKRLHERNKTLSRQVENSNLMHSNGLSSGLPQPSERVGSSGARTEEYQREILALKKTLQEMQAKHERDLLEKDKQLQERHEKQMRLSALLSDLEEKLHALQMLDSQQKQEQDKNRIERSKNDNSDEEAEERGGRKDSLEKIEMLNDRIHRLEVEKEMLTSHLFQAEKRNRQLEESLRLSEAELKKLSQSLKNNNVQSSPATSERRERRADTPGGGTAVGGQSPYVTVLQDTITTLQFRLHQTQAEKNKLEAIQLKALLESPNEPVPRVNAEVKKLFSVMKQSLVSEAIEHEAQRERMNEVMYALEREVASVGL